MWWPFGDKSDDDPIKVIDGLKKSKEILDKRFEKKEVTNDTYLQKSMEIQKKMEKCEKQIQRKANND